MMRVEWLIRCGLLLVVVAGCDGGGGEDAAQNPYASPYQSGTTDSGTVPDASPAPGSPVPATAPQQGSTAPGPSTGTPGNPSLSSTGAQPLGGGGPRRPTTPMAASGNGTSNPRVESSLPEGENAFEIAFRKAGAEPEPQSRNSSFSFGGSKAEWTRWSVEADPAPADYAVPPDAKLGIKIPGLTRRGGGGFWESQHIRILYPRSTSPFVAIGLNEQPNQYREVWDLRTKKRLGDIRGLGLGRSKLQSLSPDGKYFAAKPASADLVGVYDVDAEKPIQTIPLTDHWCDLVTFAGAQRLVFEDDNELQVWSVPDFELQQLIELDRWANNSVWALSPGGRYLVIVSRSGFKTEAVFYDLDDGSKAGALALSEKSEVQGVAFSDDGEQFAVLMDGFWGTGVQVWDVPDGKITVEQPLEDELKSQITPHRDYQGQQLAWFPDGRHLLMYGRGVYDIDAGQLIANLPDSTIYEIRVLDDRHIIVVQQQELVSYDLSEQLEQAAEIFAAGGTADDTNLPPLVKADKEAMQVLPPPEIPSVWTVSNVSHASRSGNLTRRPIQVPGGNVFQGVLASDASPLALLMYSEEAIRPFMRGTSPNMDNRVWIEKFDLKSGTRKKSFSFPFETALQDVSADGAMCLTRITTGKNRLDGWSTKDGTHLFGLRPFQERGQRAGWPVEFTEFVGNGHIYTMGNEELVVWKVPECRAVYSVPVGPLRPAISPSGQQIVVTDPQLEHLYILNAQTGETLGGIDLAQFASETVSAFRFNEDGTRLAAITRRPSGGQVVIVDSANGRKVQEFPLPVTADVIQWMDDRFLLLDGGSLVSRDNESIVWRYELPAGMHLIDTPASRHWYVTANSVFDKSFVLHSAALPEDGVRDRVLDPNLRWPLLMQPGGEVTLDIRIGDPPGYPGFARSIWEGLVRKYENAGITVTDTSPTWLVVDGRTESTGEKLTNDPLGTGNPLFGAPVIEIQEQRVVWDLRVEHSGQVVWQTNLVATNAQGFTYNRDASDGEIQSRASEQTTQNMWRSAVNILTEFEPPKFAFPAGASVGGGTSKLTPRGAMAD